MQGLRDRVVVVTGGAGGIGRAVVARLLGEGARVLVADRDGASLESAKRELAKHGVGFAVADIDVRDRLAVGSVPDACRDELGREPDIVVCGAGHQTFAAVADIPDDEWYDVLDVNAHGSYLTMRMAAQSFRRSGTRGAIVTIASIQARLGSVWYAHYSASKAAVLSLTKSFALELAPFGCRVNCVAPGVIDTGMWARADHELALLRGIHPGQPRAERIATVPLGRGGVPEDVAGAVAFLASEDAAYITGECLHVCGGDVML